MAALGGAAAWPMAARAQPAAVPAIGVLGGVSPALYARYVAAFVDALKQAGFAEHRNVKIEQRWSNGRLDALPSLLAELLDLKIAVLVTLGGTSVAVVAKKAAPDIPIVFAVGSDPVEDGLVTALNRPGGNITGVTFFTNALNGKRLELLLELATKPAAIAVLVNPNNARAERDVRDVVAAAASVGHPIRIARAGAVDELDAVVSRLGAEGAGALLVTSDAFFATRREQLVALAARYGLPAIYGQREFVAAGGLISYGSDVAESHRQAGSYTARILKGERAMDLPVLQPTTFELAINVKTAKALGLEIAPTLLARADEVIE